MRALDHLLYAWLAEPDERRFERAFSAYFEVAFPSLVRHLARLSGWDSERVQDLAQEALLRFFDRAGRGRRQASETAGSALAQLRPLHLGALHERHVQGWSLEVSRFRDAAMSFRYGPDDAASKSAIRALLDLIPPLQRQGAHLLHFVRLELHWTVCGELEIEASLGDLATDDPAGSESVLSRFIDELVRESTANTARAASAQQRHPAVRPFCENVFVIVGCLPRLRVPTNSYLFQIARTIYFDECKRQGRRKRGGVASQRSDDGAMCDGSSRPHPLETFDAGDGLDDSGEGASLLSAHATDTSALSVPAVDPTQAYESEEFFQRFYEYLRTPADRAAEAYEHASATGRAVSERHRLESLTNKFSRTVAVLSAIGEGHTQEQVAAKLGLSRNQVKYIIEVVQEAYTQFAAEAAGSAPSEPTAREQSHVP